MGSAETMTIVNGQAAPRKKELQAVLSLLEWSFYHDLHHLFLCSDAEQMYG
jgi:hypothetical protein